MKKYLTFSLLFTALFAFTACSETTNDLMLEISNTDIVFDNEHGNGAYVDVMSNGVWSLVKDDDAQWLRVTPEKGEPGLNGFKIISVNVSAELNLTGKKRTAKIHFKHEKGFKKRTLKVTQMPKQTAPPVVPIEPNIELSVNVLAFTIAEATSKQVLVESNVDWTTIRNGDDGATWVTVDPEEGRGAIEAKTMTVSVTRNTSKNQRVAKIIVVSASGKESKEIVITQVGAM